MTAAARALAFTWTLAVSAIAAAQAQAQTGTGVPPVSALLANLVARSIGPARPGANGRITDVAVYEKEPRIFLVASASGGVFKTENAGASFSAIFDREGSSSIGAVAISQSNPRVLWVGTGEGTNRNSVGWGDGVYKSTDGGKTWKHMGLPKSYSFSRIVVDPKDENTVYAAVVGSTWGYNPERGVYQTTDGGKTWQRILYVDEKTGAADLAMDPHNPRNLLAAMWEHQRTPYSFRSGGAGSGLYRTVDGGKTWHKARGLPEYLGRIALSYFWRDPRIVVASVEAREGAQGGARVYRSTDGGTSWARLPSVVVGGPVDYPPNYPVGTRPFYCSNARQDPRDVSRLYAGCDILRSDDMGRTFRPWAGGDTHALWINPSDPKHILEAGDLGVTQTRDGGETWEFLNLPPIGQFYGIGYDMRKPYWVYGGTQDAGNWALPTQGVSGEVGAFDSRKILHDDGMQHKVDPDDWTTLYSGARNGELYRIDQRGGDQKRISPFPHMMFALREGRRATWNTPFILSPWNSRTLYLGANVLFKSVDRGDTWRAISPDLTKNNPDWQRPDPGDISPESTGAEVYGAITTVSESPLKQGLVWVGTDDGNVQLTRDDGAHWVDLTSKIPDLPPNTWASRIVASRFAEGRAYATFDRHRSNDYRTYVYVTEDHGQRWTRIDGDLPPGEPAYVIREGLRNPDLLFLGTEFSLFISLDRGQTWTRYRTGDFPTVAIHDLEIHPREEELIIGTHGRSIWILPVGPLEELTPERRRKEVHFTRPGHVYLLGRRGGGSTSARYAHPWSSPNSQPGTLFAYYLRQGGRREATIAVTDPSGTDTLVTLKGPAKAGLNTVRWDDTGLSSITERLERPGDYRVVLTIDGRTYTQTLHAEDATP